MGKNLGELLRSRWGEDWLIGVKSSEFWEEIAYFAQFLEDDNARNSLVLIQESAPLKFLAKFFAACGVGRSMVLANPQWGKWELDQISQLRLSFWSEALDQEEMQNHQQDNRPPDLESLAALSASKPGRSFLREQEAGFEQGGPKILIPTGGTSGQMKFVVHTWQTLMASVQGFRSHFEVNQVNAYCVLPMFHVSGLMQALRVFGSGGKLVLQPYQELKQGRLLPTPSGGFLSLVPTQLQWLLEQGDVYLDWLRNFRAVLLGGAPAWPSLLQGARENNIPLALTYGMSETASQVATLLPELFLAGNISNGRALPHAQIVAVGPQNQPLKANEIGQIAISAQSLAMGYLWPNRSPQFSPLELRTVLEDPRATASMDRQMPSSSGKDEAQKPFLLTDDLGYLDGEGTLTIVGRCSTKLITGGENVFPEEVEAVLLTLEGIQDVCVVGLPDQQWGQRLCAAVVLQAGLGALTDLASAVRPRLTPYKRPKNWVAVDALPRTAQGKVNRKLTLELVQKVFGNYDPPRL